MADVIVFEHQDKQTTLSHRQLCNAFRRAVGPGRYKAAFARYEEENGRVSTDRVRQIILYEPKTQVTLNEPDLRTVKAAVEGECKDLSATAWSALLDTEAGPPGSDPLPPQTWTQIFRHQRPWFWGVFDLPQQHLRGLVGQYFIIRRVSRRRKGYLVALMSVQPDTSTRQPAAFTTVSHQTRDSDEPPWVDGIMYESGDFIFCLGKVRDRSRFRGSIVMRHPRPRRRNATEDIVYDLKGLRLGMGRNAELPQAYRIWCTKLDPPEPGKDWADLVNLYADEEFERQFAGRIDRYAEMVKWLGAYSSLPLIDEE